MPPRSASGLVLSHLETPVGDVVLAAHGGALAACALAGQRLHRELMETGAPERDGEPVLAAARAWLEAYFSGAWPDACALPPLDPLDRTPFRDAVWAHVRRIRRGRTTTYGAIARELACERGRAVSAQAVGQAVGANPLCVVVPCHRVLAANGIGGYAGGLAPKLWLLEHEGTDCQALPMPAHGRFAGGEDRRGA